MPGHQALWPSSTFSWEGVLASGGLIEWWQCEGGGATQGPCALGAHAAQAQALLPQALLHQLAVAIARPHGQPQHSRPRVRLLLSRRLPVPCRRLSPAAMT